jgi:hypothetical protein
MTLPKPNRRQFVGSLGAGLLLAPFLSRELDERRALAAAGPAGKSKRVLLFCTMGTYPPIWKPTAVAGESITTFSTSTSPLAAVKDSIVLVEGLPSGNPNDNHGSPDGITGLGFGYYNGQLKISVDQFIAAQLVASGIKRPIASLLLGGNTNSPGGNTMFYGGSGGNNLPTIGSPLSAYTTVFGGALPAGVSSAALLARRKSILDLVSTEARTIKATLGSVEGAKLDLHLESIRQLESKLSQTAPSAAGCMRPAMPDVDSKYIYMETVDALATNLFHLDIIINAFACDITRVAAIEYGNDQTLMVNLPGRLPFDDQHGGFIHSGADSNYKNLIEFEKYLAEQFVSIINKLKSFQDPEDPSKTLYDTTLLVWCRDMGDGQNHDQKEMRFVLASGNGGYLKTAPGGRYFRSTERHERVLLNICEAMGITSYTGFGDPGLTGASKTPLPGIAA